MRFIRRNCNPDSKVFEMTKAVAQKYLECLNNSCIFEMKMKRLVVQPFDLPLKCCAYGVTRNNQSRNDLIIVFDESGSDKFLAFVIAHEMAHILMYPQGDKLLFQKKRIRYTVDGKDRFRENTFLDDTETEEALADHLACYIVSKMNYEDTEGAMEEYLQRDIVVQHRALAARLDARFGKPLMECEKIDEYCTQEDEIVISNALWYNCVTHFIDSDQPWVLESK